MLLRYWLVPKPSRDKASLHLALPFKIPNATVRIGIGDTCVTPESGRIPGSNNDFFCAQRWIDVSNDSMGVTIVCPQGALWEVGEMVDERKVNPGKGTNPEMYKAWKTEAKSSSTIYLYALNNYWHTNFKADQPGHVSFRVTLLPHGAFDAATATRAAQAMVEPPVVVADSEAAVSGDRPQLDNARVVIASLTPTADGRADLVRLWNPGPRAEVVRLLWTDNARAGATARPRAVSLSDLDEGRGAPVAGALRVPAMGSVTLRVERP